MKHVSKIAALSLALLACAGCTFMDKATDFNGLPDHDGKQVMHMNQTRIACNLFFTYMPLAGDASLEASVANLTAEARADGASGVRIVQSDDSLLWWIFPPFSFIFTPVYSNVAADAVMK